MSRIALVLGLLLVAACAAPGTPPVAEPPPKQAASTEPDDDSAPPPAAPKIDLLPPDHAGLPRDGALKPDLLIGLLDNELERILGEPDFRRKDPPAEIWQYRNTSCRFDVFLFQDKARANAYAVTHIEARGLDVNRVSKRECFLSVLKDRKPG